MEQYFDKIDFVFVDYKSLIKEYNTTVIEQEESQSENIIEQEQPVLDDNKDKLSKVRTEILKYESGEKLPKHIGQRMFGYLLKSGYINAYNDTQRIEQWKLFTELDSLPEMSYLLKGLKIGFRQTITLSLMNRIGKGKKTEEVPKVLLIH